MRIDTIFYGIKLRSGSLSGSCLAQERSAMNKAAQKPNRVMAVFQDSRLSFDLARGATLAQLADRLGRLGEAHGGLPLYVELRVPVDGSH